MASHTTEIPASTGLKNKARHGSLEEGAVGMEIPVRVHGSQISAIVLESTEHVEPFEENTTTMIVFPRGTVVRLDARVRAGHAVVLTNLRTHQTALCRVVQVNSVGGTTHYVKLEFIESADGFWDAQPATGSTNSDLGVSRSTQPHGLSPQREERAASSVPAIEPEPPARAPSPQPTLAPASTPPLALPSQSSGRGDARPGADNSAVREMSRIVVTQEPVAAAPAQEYGAPQSGVAPDLVPIAAAPPAPAKKRPRGTPAGPVDPRKATQARPAKAHARLGSFTSLGQHLPDTDKDTAATDDPLAQLSFGDSPVSAAVSPGKWGIALAVICVLTVGAAGAKYYLNRPSSVTPAPGSTSSAAQSPSLTASEMPAEPASSSAVPSPNSQDLAAQSSAPSQNPSPLAPTPKIRVPSSPRLILAPKTASQHVGSNGLSGLYAGDLTARPKIVARNMAPVASPLPVISMSVAEKAPMNASASPLGSLVTATGNTNLVPPAPVEGQPAVRDGGKVRPAHLLRSPAPVYPQVARTDGVQGDVRVLVDINAFGKVKSMKVLSGPLLLRAAAVDALRSWKYAPATLNGKPIAGSAVVVLRFRLNQ